MIVNVMAATGEIKPNQILLAKAMGYGRIESAEMMFPAMLPVLSSGLYYACNASITVSHRRGGAGAPRSRRGSSRLRHGFQTAELYAAVVLTASIAAAINLALWYAARYFGRWRG